MIEGSTGQFRGTILQIPIILIDPIRPCGSRNMNRRNAVLIAAALVPACARAQTPTLSPNAPRDRVSVVREERQAAYNRMLQPHIDSARTTWPEVKARFLADRIGEGSHLFVVTRLRDAAGHMEQVFVAVQRIAADGRIHGAISSHIGLVEGYRYGQPYSLAEADLIDWVISRPDGTEEGNFVGRFIENMPVNF